MVIKTGKFVSLHISPIDNSAIQPNGVDLHINQVNEILGDSKPILKEDNRIHAETLNLDYTPNGFYNLSAGKAYRVVYREVIRIPNTCVGLIIVRSSLQRNGVWLSTALWDSGYEGRGSGTLFCFSNLQLHKDFAIGQLILMDADKPDTMYQGNYQHEGLDTSDEIQDDK